MTYSEKKQQSNLILKRMQSLKEDEVMEVYYGKDREGRRRQYKIRSYSNFRDVRSYSIWNAYSGMNIDTIGQTVMKAYTFDLMSQKTTYTFPLYQLELVEDKTSS